MDLPDLFNLYAGLIIGLVASFGIGVMSFRQPLYSRARGCAWIAAALFVSIGIVWGVTTDMPTRIWLPIVAIVGAVTAVGLVGALRTINSAEAQTPEPNMSNDPPQSIINNKGIITHGQSGGSNTIINGAMPRHLGPQDKSDMLAAIPKDRKVWVTGQAGDADTADLSNEIVGFLKQAGYDVEGPTIGMIVRSDGAVRGINIQLNQDRHDLPVQITVGVR